ncbi:hypothetical protein RN001_003800 [Aquatica leii]|uniref:Uncharacterized protein n=1 Tax=Aquatica leii TaxID=1421715 RepID=A0AAN7PIV1_9COLE|nr:hypothetical protein RN001_003800 [Aquatica leii]
MDIENLDEIEEQWGSIEENIILKIESYNDSVNLTKEFLDNLIKQTQLIGKSRRNLEKTLIKEHNQLEVTNNQDYELEQLTLRLKQLENTEASLEEDVSNAESKFNHMEKIESDKLEAYNKVYLKYRDLCKASKVLTRTTFNYQSSNVTGSILFHSYDYFSHGYLII